MRSIERVAVLGGGLMGSGIAESVARTGVPVVVRDVDEAAFEAARGRVEKSLGRARDGGKIDADEYEEILGRVSYTDRLEAIADADLVVEAVPENADLKAAILGQVAGIVSEDALIASNTSSIPIAQLAAGLPRPDRVLGLHFFSPVPVMGLIEIVVALDTSEETVASAQDFAERVGKRAIITKDRSGFIVNMLLVPYLMAAVRMYEEGFAT
ncbi:MAG: 3-hydroxybutyryl-CoA dehydrogenase, partial [Solirubrobacterales bacterium]|nr:3-hydroxybutyryl-CoA dehydrogenase [Solirubrobacterales bacterium]